MNTDLLVKVFEGSEVFFVEDGWFNATLTAKRFGKDPADWTVSDEAFNYGVALAKSLNELNSHQTPFLDAIKNCQSESAKRVKIPKFLKEVGLLHTKRGSPENGGGTWFHPKLGITFARWLSAEFAVWCDMEIERILHNYRVSNKQPKFVTEMHPILQFPVIGRQEDLLMKGTRNTYTVVLDSLRFAAAIYKQVLTNNVSRILIGMPVKPFRRLHGIPAGSRRRTRLYYDSNLRRAMNEIEDIACMRLREEYLDEEVLIKSVTFEEIEKLVYEVAGTIRDYTRLRSVNLLEHVPEQEFEM